ncbi:MAG: nucleotidyl transferase AbiEii/AbiGii toxin family protein [Actinomycetota bacterium]|nr:nucleotidyl transferase AbiEii/AbiGii toxin family protein [Actinomycetota bacterium]
MTPLAALLRNMVEALAEIGAPFALVGGLAVSARTEPRFTRDIDLVVAVEDDREAEAVVRTLAPSYEVLATLEHDSLQRLAAVRVGQAGTGAAEAVVDLLFASSGIEAEIAAAATAVQVFPMVSVAVARTGHLLALKLLARDQRRPQDDVDLRALLEVAEPAEIHLATEAISLIMRRGANRGRDLQREWRRLLASRA